MDDEDDDDDFEIPDTDDLDPADRSPWILDDTVPLVRVAEYEGQSRVEISATQLDGTYSAREARRVVEEWCEFFSAGSSPITHLQFRTRTPARLFDALRGQLQLQHLYLHWGDYADLSVLENMTFLRELHLGNAVRVTSLEPLRNVQSLVRLKILLARRLGDYSPLVALANLQYLGILSDVDDLNFLVNMPALRGFTITGKARDLNYLPVMLRADLEELFVAEYRGMSPAYKELVRAIPALR